MEIFITRDTGGSVMAGGLDRINVWFCEPCLQVRETGFHPGYDHPFDDKEISSEDAKDYKEFVKSLQGVLYEPNVINNFIFRKDNSPINHAGEFGDKLVCNGSGVDFPELLIEYHKERLLSFEFKVFGGGTKINYRPNRASVLFGFPDDKIIKAPDISQKIWDLVCEDFKGIPFREWDKAEMENPWWRFCKKLNIKMSLE